ncbi:CoA ester lyase [Parvibaculaceae bacterium PLY_AMNH_Bact1]|nr:CoA ester lyase [Parvibaculaceae bacterium PLY_AMNH_Bact1]
MRSFLFVPADSDRKLAKGAGSGADALILDLEDAVALDNKPAARQGAIDYLQSRAPGDAQTVLVRMNALDSNFWQQDLASVVPAKPDAIMVPKTISGECIAKVCAHLSELEKEHGLQQGSIRLMNVATETAASMFNLGTYGNTSERFFAMTWGAEDLSADLGARSNRDEEGNYTDPYRLARTLCLLGAVAADVMPIDGICKDFRDEAALEAEARAAIRDGFTGKVAIHPAQVAIINAVFTPTEEDIAEARAVVKAFADAGNPGVVGLDGKMLDRPHLRQAESVIARAEAMEL